MAAEVRGWLICLGVIVAALATATTADAAGWAIQPTPNPTIPQATLSAVSCTSASACVATGSAPYESGRIAALAEHWNGSKWTVQSTPEPAGAAESELDGVSCSSMRACVAVGHYIDSAGTTVTLSETWDGTRWSIQPTPNPDGATFSVLSGVSCTSAAACTAVGNYNQGSQDQLSLAERWNGSSWTIQSTPNQPGSGGSLSGVSCTTATSCEAVGGDVGGDFEAPSLAEVWDGTVWTIQPTPNNPRDPHALASVSCTSPTACTAVGPGLAERWDGTSWTIQSTPDTSDGSPGSLLGVSCTTTSACTAVGYYWTGPDSTVTLAEVWNGIDWTIQRTPSRRVGPFNILYGVSCASSPACVAVGTFDARPSTWSIAERWDGSRWTFVAAANPPGDSDTSLVDVSCSSARQCVAVGSYVNPFGHNDLVAEGWNGSRWRLQRTPIPNGAVGDSLHGVSCPRARACVAVGEYKDSIRGPWQPMAEGWNGRRWSLQPISLPAGARGGGLLGVSCTRRTACIAVGIYFDGTGTTMTLAEGWNGRRWTIQSTPNPAGSKHTALNGVSCSTARVCTAVGSYTNGAGNVVPLAEARSISGWVIQIPPLPAGVQNASLGAVSCSAATACTAVGGYTGGQLAERWDGSRWTVQPMASPPGKSPYEWGVSCPSSTDCIAVGSYRRVTKGFIYYLTLAEAWNGSNWTVQPTPNPPGSVFSSLYGTSCPTKTYCAAVGSSYGLGLNGGDGPFAALAESHH